jgi:predicted phage terminase large subunit-like protein
MSLDIKNSINYETLLPVILRQDFVCFILKVFHTINPSIKYKHNWHIETIAEYLENAKNGDIKRLLINMPPRWLKSLCISVAFPAWILGHDPSKRVIVASYSNILSIKHSLDCKLVIESDWYQNIFPNTIISSRHNQKSKFLTTQNGFRFATSVGGSLTGEGGDYLIVDDPHNPVQANSQKYRDKTIDWFEQTFITRLNDKSKGSIIVVMQRLHNKDLSNHLLLQNSWKHLMIPVISNQDIAFGKFQFKQGDILNEAIDSYDELQKFEKEMGIKNYQAQYMQSPLPDNNSILSHEDLLFYVYQDNMHFEYFVQSWDTAIKVSDKSDYSVCSCWGIIENKYYLVDLIRKKMTYPELKLQIQKLHAKYNPKWILIEDKASGQSVIQDLKQEGFSNIYGIKPQFDKITRFASCSPIFQKGRVLIPDNLSLKNILLNELLSFPSSKHDDIVDSCSQFINFMKTKNQSVTTRIRTL